MSEKTTTIFFSIAFLAIAFMLLYMTAASAAINGLTNEKCKIQTETIIKISEGTSNDIVFSDNHLDSLKTKVLNKTVTLHLPKLFGGAIISEHVAQIAVDDNIIFTELN